MPRSFLVKQHDKTIDEQRSDVDEDSKAPEISQDPPVPSLPPPLLKVSPRTSSQSVWVAKDDRHIPKFFTRSPTEDFYQRNIKSEVDVELLHSSVKSRAPILERSLADAWMLTGIDSRASIQSHPLDGLTRQHGYRGVGYGQKQYVDTGYYQRPAEQKFHLQQRMELEKKGILNPLYSGGSVYHDPFMCYSHSLYTNTGLYGAKENTMFNQVNLLPKYYMTTPGSSTAYKTSQRKEQGADVNPKKQVDCRTTTKPDSSTNETNAVQSSQEIEALDHEYPASKTTTTPSQGDESKVEQSIAARKYRYTCDVCGKSFSRSNTLTTHKRIHTGAKPFICEQCGRAFRQPGNLTRHRLTHTAIKPYVCTQCNKAFNRASNLHTHMRTHTNYKPFVCDFCGKGFHQKIDMKIHRYTHTGEKPHKCNKCGRGFKQLTHLTYHMRTHSDERLYKCEYCGKGFNQKGNLQAHIYGHTGERPFKCDICGKGFTLASTLNTHKRTHATKKPFECQFCGKAFYQKNALKTHYIASHPFANGMSLL